MGVTKQPTRLQSGMQIHIKTNSSKNLLCQLAIPTGKKFRKMIFFLNFIRSILSHKDHSDAGNFFYYLFSPIILISQN